LKAKESPSPRLWGEGRGEGRRGSSLKKCAVRISTRGGISRLTQGAKIAKTRAEWRFPPRINTPSPTTPHANDILREVRLLAAGHDC
jgi:hypothetical protein